MIEEKLLKEHVDYLVKIMNDMEYNKCTLLTGFNGCGKSLIRKQMNYHVKKIHDKAKVSSISMQLRTESRASFGALSSAMHDLPWSPTSECTYYLIEKLFESQFNRSNKDIKSYIILDEPEIGMSKESQLGIALYIKNNIDKVLDNSYGLLIITHSEIIVETLKNISNFININKEHKSISAEDLLNRDVVATDFNELREWSNALFNYVESVAKKSD